MTVFSRRQFGLFVGVAAAASLTAGAVIAASAQATEPPVTGSPAPAFSVEDINGVTWSLADLGEDTVVLEWTNNECPYVRKHYESGSMQALQAEATEAGVVWLQIISSAPGEQGHVSAETAALLNEERGASPTAAILDPSGDLGRLYDARTTPHMFVIEHGELVYQGAIDDRPTSNIDDIEGARNYVREALEAIAAGEPIAAPETRAYGCNVKYG